MDTLNLVLANNGVLEGTAGLDNEDSISTATLSLASARFATAIGLQATIEGAADSLGSLQGNRALGSRDGKASALVKAEELSGSGGSRASGDSGHKGSDRGGDGELHVDD